MATEQVVERPIIFSAPMVRAILDGRKTQTRRAVTEPLVSSKKVHGVCGMNYSWMRCDDWKGHENEYRVCGSVAAVRSFAAPTRIRCPYGKPGDRLWVREKHSLSCENFPLCGSIKYMTDEQIENTTVWYHEQNSRPTWAETRWRSPLFMPRWASRIVLEIVDIRLEELKFISYSDAIAEGMPERHPSIDFVSRGYGFPDFTRSYFAHSWDQLNEKRGFPWSANPWVWVIEFRRV